MCCCIRYFLEVIVVALVMTVAINVYIVVWGTQIWSILPAACEKVSRMRCIVFQNVVEKKNREQ